jgi:hypothetical protein
MSQARLNRRAHERQLATALCDALAQHAELRPLWLSIIIAINPTASIPEQYAWLWSFHNRIGADLAARLEIFLRAFRKRAPEAPSWLASRRGRALLMEIAERCAAGRYRDPCRPLDRRGRPPNTAYFETAEEFCRVIVGIMRQLLAQGVEPTQDIVAQFLSRTPGYPALGPRALRYYCEKFDVDWNELKRKARQA